MKQLEPFWYEISPFIYLIFGLATIVLSNHLGVMFGVLLMAVALSILTLRWHYRSNRTTTVRESQARRTPTLPRRNTGQRRY